MTDFSKVRARKEKFLKRSMLPIHRAHAENSLVISFHVTGFRISARLTCSGRGWGGDKGLYETGRAAFVYKAHFFRSLPVPLWMGLE